MILSGAGFPPDHPPSPGLKFVVYAAIGHYDFNFPEIVQLRQALERDKITHHIDVFDGSHQWMPPPVAQAAIEWLNLQAMASGVLPRDEAFVAAQWSQRLQQAQAEEHNHDFYEALNSYSSLAADFGPLRDVGEARAAVERLRNSPEFHRAQASLDDQLRKQNSITAPIIAKMISLASNPNGEIVSLPQIQQPSAPMQPNPAGRPSAGGPMAPDSSGGPEMVRQQLEGELTSLRKQRERETNPEKLTVLRRAVGAVFAQAYESGLMAVESKQYRVAVVYFELAPFVAPKASAELHYTPRPLIALPATRNNRYASCARRWQRASTIGHASNKTETSIACAVPRSSRPCWQTYSQNKLSHFACPRNNAAVGGRCVCRGTRRPQPRSVVTGITDIAEDHCDNFGVRKATDIPWDKSMFWWGATHEPAACRSVVMGLNIEDPGRIGSISG